MQIVFFAFRIPSDEGVSGFEFPCGRAPTQTGNGPISDKGDILEMIADNLTIAEIRVLMDQGVVEWFEFCVSNRFEINNAQIDRCIL